VTGLHDITRENPASNSIGWTRSHRWRSDCCRARYPRGAVSRGLAAVKPDAALMTLFRFTDRLHVTDLTVNIRLSGT
jgi:hypothetical protein